ncbi:PepSY domain-containing protein [Leptobacterium sp. I13]|uniref:PepSY domain-containing protein n=1 Tax=Leptobacterium meishanense TaxID=3128904 RepID=UPI0030EC5419
MVGRKTSLRIRKIHRYLGLFLGVQFIFWTLGGLYFSWSNMDEIHGDTYRNPSSYLNASDSLVSPSLVIQKISEKVSVDSLKSVQLIEILEKPVYRIHYFSEGKVVAQLADASSGVLRSSLTKEEAVLMAQQAFKPHNMVESVEYLTATGKHHEYRARSLPAWAVTFEHPSRTTIYIAAEEGVIERFRNRNWRIFDFFWMMHTMDYEGRDHFGNWLLRAFSILGFVTVFFGFLLWFVTSPTIRKAIKTKKP